ncbi:hypothetical protein G7Z17_g8232 [Cylindrodendrum hubeiense]|uniref:Major facilitator superfamily (MFS) profile domain-containing protein n=1 Tax=Cylindrodendrum hubeiense TaxID=595255 RepID=A0A9P5H1K2_9HYPO|nr:hypothetical protein G7Z17_g8232 [Cylindrodendrum hubeiense]
MAPSVEKPETWAEFGHLNQEFTQMLENGVKPRFSQDNKLSSLPETRKRYHAVFEGDADAARKEAGSDVIEEEILFPVRDGSKIRALLYRPREAPADGSPLVIMIHGGGFILGNAEMETPPCIAAVKAFSCVAVSIEYRLSPEVKFPVAYEDCWDGLKWFSKNAESYGANLKKGFVLGGTSAGGHISVPLSHRARDEGLTPPLTGIYLSVTPSIVPQALTEKYKPFYRSREALKDGVTLTSKSIDLYDIAVEPDFTSPLWSPLLWPTGHANMPPTFFQVCGSDILRDEALIYERELRLEHGTKTKVIISNKATFETIEIVNTMGNIRDMDIVTHMTWPLLWVAIYCSIGGIGFGIDFGYWSGMLGMKQFKHDFGVYDPQADAYYLPSSWKSAGSGPPIAGLAIGSLISGLIGNRLGRISTFRISSYISIVGIVIQSASIGSYWQLTVGRIINSLALGIVANAVPAYLAEVSPLSIRGTLVNCYQFAIGVGAVLVNTATWGMQARSDQWAYRLVMIIQIVQPIFFVLGSFFIPESPRWLLGKGHQERAISALQTLQSGTPRELIEREAGLIAAAEEENRANFNNSWKECFIGSNLRRTLIATGVQCFKQAQGDSFMSSYSVLFFQSLGVQDVYKIMILFLLTMALSSGFGFYIPDRFGRRPILISTAALMGVCMYIVAGLKGFSLAESASATKGATAALFIWEFAMSVGWSSCVWIVTAEVPSLQLREKTMTIATFSGFCVSILITFVNPFIQDEGYGNLGACVGFLYGGFSFVAAIWAYLTLPETAFRTLEELDELFQADIPTRQFRKFISTGIGAQIAEVEAATRQSKLTDNKLD